MMTEASTLVKWGCLLFCVIFTGCVSDSPQRDHNKPQALESNKNTTLPGKVPTGTTSSTSRPPPTTPENCSDLTFRDARDCPSKLNCHELGRECLDCTFNCSCVYGQEINVTCRPKKDDCEGKKEFTLSLVCRYCYQTASWEHTCLGTDQCLAVTSPRETFTSNCTVKSNVLCLGNRIFPKKLPCNWTSGYKWSTALLLSITLGGFGADRFYLGHWQEGIGKLFSFGGLGVWTIIDVILIAIRYLGPADGSLYI
ncbi:TM2 domain-containing protein 3-like [Homarus americanus]|uniref:TM2 domain-containing protein 3-like n=1 Tax=Homarus americanus TaxID=6706 RepID=A0A8J5MJV9_HOMAM|nr:TM2 domain-containing protein 3-like [Homarus americanus]XP_042208667.1 TM2 domain-containing protein 3-like [Homarus americanus]KAG7153922.1 TM2 domain-containing protein 3-like [Homarus americanus]